jgi:hypothetical protein
VRTTLSGEEFQEVDSFLDEYFEEKIVKIYTPGGSVSSDPTQTISLCKI